MPISRNGKHVPGSDQRNGGKAIFQSTVGYKRLVVTTLSAVDITFCFLRRHSEQLDMAMLLHERSLAQLAAQQTATGMSLVSLPCTSNYSELQSPWLL